jgi:hypothetical protein
MDVMPSFGRGRRHVLKTLDRVSFFQTGIYWTVRIPVIPAWMVQ